MPLTGSVPPPTQRRDAPPAARRNVQRANTPSTRPYLINMRQVRLDIIHYWKPIRIGDMALRCIPEEVTLSDLRWSTPSAQVTA